jgi:hypothetical protein
VAAKAVPPFTTEPQLLKPRPSWIEVADIPNRATNEILQLTHNGWSGMPDSDTPAGWYPPGWVEAIEASDTGREYIEWRYESDPAINVTLTPTEDGPGLTVWAQAGINEEGEKLNFRPVQGLPEEDAFAVALTLFSAMNGAIRRVTGDPNFNGDS